MTELTEFRESFELTEFSELKEAIGIVSLSVMATFKRFEEIEAWKKAREVTRLIYSISNSERFAKDFCLRDQIRRASISIMANIAEGHGRRTSSEFANFLNIARGSAVEVQSHLYIALDLKYVEKGEFERAYEMLEEISKMTISLSQYLRKTR